MKAKVAIIDYGIGNVQSVYNAVTWLGYNAIVTNLESEFAKANALILPGVGSFETAMESIKNDGLDQRLEEQVLHQKKPILGICLGMQLFASRSEEGGDITGLDWIKGEVVKLKKVKDLYVPNVGWNETSFVKNSVLATRLSDAPTFYYDHSYHFECGEDDIAATCSYGSQIVAAVRKDNIFGVQFHPEKSQSTGLKLLRGFFNHVNEQ